MAILEAAARRLEVLGAAGAYDTLFLRDPTRPTLTEGLKAVQLTTAHASTIDRTKAIVDNRSLFSISPSPLPSRHGLDPLRKKGLYVTLGP
jgi:hypothetical protein